MSGPPVPIRLEAYYDELDCPFVVLNVSNFRSCRANGRRILSIQVQHLRGADKAPIVAILGISAAGLQILPGTLVTVIFITGRLGLVVRELKVKSDISDRQGIGPDSI